MNKKICENNLVYKNLLETDVIKDTAKFITNNNHLLSIRVWFERQRKKKSTCARNCENSTELGVFLPTKPSSIERYYRMQHPENSVGATTRSNDIQTRLIADAFPNPGASFLPAGERIVVGAYFRKSRRTDWPTIPIRSCIRTSNMHTPPFASHFFRSLCLCSGRSGVTLSLS